MRVQIDTPDDQVNARVNQLLQFSLTRAPTEITDARIIVDGVCDTLGAALTRCRANLRLRNGDEVSVEEIQSSLDVAVSRALQRSLRTARLRLATGNRLYSSLR